MTTTAAIEIEPRTRSPALAVGVGIVGASDGRPLLAHTLASLPECRSLVCSARESQDLAVPATGTTKLVLLPSDEAVLADPAVEAVIVAAPATDQVRLTRKAVAAGKHVLVDSPLAMDFGSAVDLVRAAESQRLILAAAQFELDKPAIKALSNLVAHRVLGEVQHVWALRSCAGLGDAPDVYILSQHVVNDVCVIKHLLGRPTAVRARGSAHRPADLSDFVCADLFFGPLVMATCVASRCLDSNSRQIVLVGSRRVAVLDEAAQHPLLVYGRGAPAGNGRRRPRYGARRRRNGAIAVPTLIESQPAERECRDFLRAILSGENHRDSRGRSALAVTAIHEALEASFRAGGTLVSLPMKRSGFV